MTTRDIPKAHWEHYFDTISKTVEGMKVEISILKMDLGDQIAEKSASLQGISYDPKDDCCYIFTKGFKHLIESPKRIWAIEEGVKVSAIGIEDEGGYKQIIQMRSPVLLHAP